MGRPDDGRLRLSVKRGDIVDVFFPFSDLNQVKIRPALVVQSDALSANVDVVVACITGRTNRTGIARVPVKLSDPQWAPTKLKVDSVVLADKLATVDKKAIRSTRG